MRDNPELLKCNLCVAENGAAYRTDRLWLRHIKGRDYLVCRSHRGGHSRVRELQYVRPVDPVLS